MRHKINVLCATKICANCDDERPIHTVLVVRLRIIFSKKKLRWVKASITDSPKNDDQRENLIYISVVYFLKLFILRVLKASVTDSSQWWSKRKPMFVKLGFINKFGTCKWLKL